MADRIGHQTVISTGDKDLTQLVNKHIKVVNTMSDELLDEKGVEKKFGVKPNLIIDYLALVGDSSDNIPGVEKVGPKTAVKWLQEHGNLDNIIKNSENIPGKVGENLRNGLDQLKLSKKLVTIKKDVNLKISLDDLKVDKEDKNSLEKIYTELEFKTWLEADSPVKNTIKKEEKYDLIVDEKTLNKWVERLKKSSIISLDTETNGLDYMLSLIHI